MKETQFFKRNQEIKASHLINKQIKVFATVLCQIKIKRYYVATTYNQYNECEPR